MAIRHGILVSEQRATTEREIAAKLQAEQATEVLFHHRLPTSTPNFYVVHNGVISNAEALRSRRETDGFRYTTLMRTEWITQRATYYDHIFNDSEALAVEPARHLDGSSAAIAADGSIAFIAWQADKQTRRLRGVHYGRNEGSPLVVHETADVLSITNEGDPSHERVSPHVLRSYDSQRRAWRERAAPIGACTPSHCSAGVSLWQSENDFTYEDDDLSNMARTDSVGEVKHAQQSGLVYDV
jgi:hypothetical protein